MNTMRELCANTSSGNSKGVVSLGYGIKILQGGMKTNPQNLAPAKISHYKVDS